MRTLLITLFLLLSKGYVHSSELPAEKEDKWQIQFNYARLYNYRYARIPPNADSGPPYLAYLDTGHIATYSNSISLLIQRKIWKFIHIQTGFILSRRGYLGSYTKYRNFNIIEWYPSKCIFMPLTILLCHTFENHLFLSLGMGGERKLLTFKEKIYWPTTLAKSSKGFFGYDWNKNRNLDPNTIIEDDYPTVNKTMFHITTNVGFKINKRTILALNFNYCFYPKFYKVTIYGGDPNLNLTYILEEKPYILGAGASIAYSF
jgi:hypothetical protein